MDLPSLRHFRNEGIYFIFSDPVEALIGEAWVPARYTDKGWATADGSSLLSGVEDWRYAVKEGQIAGCDLGEHQTRDQSGQATQASSRNRVRKSRKVTQEEEG
jgi:hypothetical protein